MVMAHQFPATNPSTEFKDLPFVKDGGRYGPRDFWAVEPTGDFCADYDTGEQYALMFLEHENQFSHPRPSLGCVVRDISRSGDTNGIVFGFMQTIGDVYMAVLRGDPTFLLRLEAFYSNRKARSEELNRLEREKRRERARGAV